MVAIRIYVEGGGDAKALRTACRRGFNEFFRKAGMAGKMPRVIACGSRQMAYADFRAAIEQIENEEVLLLVDSEAPVSPRKGPWEHLATDSGDRWKRPSGATDDQCHLMVQCMESWFLADRAALTEYFGKGFKASALPGRKAVEMVSKADVLRSLDRASRRAGKKGRYAKGAHSFVLLARIDPSRVRQASPHAARLLRVLELLVE